MLILYKLYHSLGGKRYKNNLLLLKIKYDTSIPKNVPFETNLIN